MSDFRFKPTDMKKLLETMCNNFHYIDTIFLKKTFQYVLEKHEKKEEDLEKEYTCITELMRKAHKEEDTVYYAILAQNATILLDLMRLKKTLENVVENVPYFLPFFFDFRGRFYYLSDISPTFYKEFRFCFHKGKYENLETKFDPLNAQIRETLNKHLSLIDE